MMNLFSAEAPKPVDSDVGDEISSDSDSSLKEESVVVDNTHEEL